MLRTLALATLLLASGAALPILLARAQTPSAAIATPPMDLNDPAIVKAGEALYLQTCRYCHGKEGQGGRGPMLRGRGLDPRYIFGRVENGYPPMPAFNRLYTPEQVWQLVAFVESMK